MFFKIIYTASLAMLFVFLESGGAAFGIDVSTLVSAASGIPAQVVRKALGPKGGALSQADVTNFLQDYHAGVYAVSQAQPAAVKKQDDWVLESKPAEKGFEVLQRLGLQPCFLGLSITTILAPWLSPKDITVDHINKFKHLTNVREQECVARLMGQVSTFNLGEAGTPEFVEAVASHKSCENILQALTDASALAAAKALFRKKLPLTVEAILSHKREGVDPLTAN